MVITLNSLKPAPDVVSALQQGYLYKDVSLDLQYGYTTNNALYATSEKKDLVSLYDVASVINSLKNILTTSPGEKILNPEFGLDLRDYLFEAVTKTKGYFIGREISVNLPTQEDRVVINTVEVIVSPEDQEYEINLDIGIPSLNISSITLNGVLNNDGYVFV